MKFGNFLFPESKSPQSDHQLIGEALQEAELTDQLGYDAIWLAEHHFDGGCVYVDPITFAAAVAARTRRVKLGFAVAQMALRHPVCFAEQVALLDNLSHGRVIAGVGRGTAFNFYEFRGFGLDPDEAHERLLESEEILRGVWTTPNYKHAGKFWQMEVAALRPQVYQKPHPLILRACSSLDSALDMARAGRPFMMNIQSNEVTRQRLDAYRQEMARSGYDDAAIAGNLADTWAWRNVVVAETDAEAEAVGVPCFRAMRVYLQENRNRMNTAAELGRQQASMRGAARDSVEQGLIVGSPATVAERLRPLQEAGLGGVIIHFRLGEMPWDFTVNSLRLFAEKVAPELGDLVAV